MIENPRFEKDPGLGPAKAGAQAVPVTHITEVGYCLFTEETLTHFTSLEAGHRSVFHLTAWTVKKLSVPLKRWTEN